MWKKIMSGLLMAVALVSVAVSRQLRRLAVVRDALADIASGEGDLTRRLDASGVDELAQIAGRAGRHLENGTFGVTVNKPKL